MEAGKGRIPEDRFRFGRDGNRFSGRDHMARSLQTTCSKAEPIFVTDRTKYRPSDTEGLLMLAMVGKIVTGCSPPAFARPPDRIAANDNQILHRFCPRFDGPLMVGHFRRWPDG